MTKTPADFWLPNLRPHRIRLERRLRDLRRPYDLVGREVTDIDLIWQERENLQKRRDGVALYVWNKERKMSLRRPVHLSDKTRRILHDGD